MPSKKPMKCKLFLKMDLDLLQDNFQFRKFFKANPDCGFAVYYVSLVTMFRKEGEGIEKENLIEVNRMLTSYSEKKIAKCLEDLVETQIFSEEFGKIYSPKLREDFEEFNDLSKKRSDNSLKRWNKETSGIQEESKCIPNVNQVESNIDIDIDKDKEEEIDKEKISVKRFVPPTVEEIKAYCMERRNDVDAQVFHDYYAEGNWTDSTGKKIKNWKQKLLSVWEGKDWWKRSKEEKPCKHGYRPEDFADVPSGGSIW